VDEVTALIKESELFNIENISVSEANWDWEDDSDSYNVDDCAHSGKNIAKAMRAVIGPLIIDQFGSAILDELFMMYASIVTKYIEKGKAKNTVIMVSMHKRP
jgi:jasmonate O-methyltransferase